MEERDFDGYLKLYKELGIEGITREKLEDVAKKGDLVTAKVYMVYQSYCKVFGIEDKGFDAFFKDAQEDLISWALDGTIRVWGRLLIEEQLKVFQEEENA